MDQVIILGKLSLKRTAYAPHAATRWRITQLSQIVVSYDRGRETRNSFIHSGYFYSASSSPLLPRGAPDTARTLCGNFTPKRHRQLQVKDLPKVPTGRLERESHPRPLGRKASTQPMRYTRPKVAPNSG